MNRMSDVVLLLLRVGTGLLLIVNHGWGKLTSAYGYVAQGKDWKFIEGVGDLGFPLPAFFAIAAALAESIGSTLLILGLFTRYAALFIMITMGVAIYRHVTTDFKFEMAALYFLIALTFLFVPPGRFSIDAKRK
jgi:putative oxidoreductase